MGKGNKPGNGSDDPAIPRPFAPNVEQSSPAAVSALESILTAVDSLSAKEAELVAHRLAIVARAKNPVARQRQLTQSDWHGAATLVLGEYGVPVLPFNALAKQSFTASFRRGCETAEEFMADLGTLTRHQRAKMRVEFARVLVRWMQRHKVPVSFKAWAQNLSNLPTAIDAAFPGYRRAGLLGVLARRA